MLVCETTSSRITSERFNRQMYHKIMKRGRPGQADAIFCCLPKLNYKTKQPMHNLNTTIDKNLTMYTCQRTRDRSSLVDLRSHKIVVIPLHTLLIFHLLEEGTSAQPIKLKGKTTTRVQQSKLAGINSQHTADARSRRAQPTRSQHTHYEPEQYRGGSLGKRSGRGFGH